eukprot:6174576-Pleurochrysis_carterae.AAC.2
MTVPSTVAWPTQMQTSAQGCGNHHIRNYYTLQQTRDAASMSKLRQRRHMSGTVIICCTAHKNMHSTT